MIFQVPKKEIEVDFNGTEVTLDIVEFKMYMDEYIGTSKQFSEFGPDIQRLLKDKYKVVASIGQCWQLVTAVERLWIDFQKKFDEELTLLIGTNSTPSNSRNDKSTSSPPKSQDSEQSKKSKTEEQSANLSGKEQRPSSSMQREIEQRLRK